MEIDDGTTSVSVSFDELARERFVQFLDEQAKSQISQQEIAKRLGVAPQFISDLKAGRRRVSELIARRLEDEFSRSRAWFLGLEDELDLGTPVARGFRPGSSRIHLPVFRRPISGDPRHHREWSGIETELCGIAASWGIASRWPYVLHFAADDRDDRLHRHDQVLISQASNDDAAIFVVRGRNDCFLARQKKSGGWEPLSPHRQDVAEAAIVGHAVGVIWTPLLRPLRGRRGQEGLEEVPDEEP